MEIKVYTPDSFADLKNAWKILENGRDMTAFQQYDWYYNINKLYFREHVKRVFVDWRYLLVTDGERPVLIAPVQIVKIGFGYKQFGLHRGFYFIGREGFSDYLNFIYDIFRAEALESVFSFLSKNFHCSYFQLEQMIEASESYRYLLQRYEHRSICLKCAILPLPNSFDEYKNTLSKSMKQNIRTAINRANRDEVVLTHEMIYDVDAKTKKEFLDIRERRLGDKVKKFKQERHPSFLGQLYGKGRNIIRCFFYAEQDVINENCNPWAFVVKNAETNEMAGYYWGIYHPQKKEYYVILAGVSQKYAWYSPCISHFYLFLQEYFEAGRQDIDAFDFTRGGEKYKHDIGCVDHPTTGLAFKRG